jgi:hypothetical protein
MSSTDLENKLTALRAAVTMMQRTNSLSRLLFENPITVSLRL